jgi:hypothetical protein
MTATITLPLLACLRCGHAWVPRLLGAAEGARPKVCPACHSVYWSRPRVRVSKQATAKWRNATEPAPNATAGPLESNPDRQTPPD